MKVEKINYNYGHNRPKWLGIHHFKTRIYSELQGIPDELQGYTIVQINDLHIDEDNIRNPNEKEWIKYGHELQGLLHYNQRDIRKTMLMVPGDIPNTNSDLYKKGQTQETSWEYMEKILPNLHHFPGAKKYVTRGNHDHEHTKFDKIKCWFADNNFINMNQNSLSYDPKILENGVHSCITTNTINIGNKEIGIVGLPDYLYQSEYFTPEMYDNLQEVVNSYDYSIIMIHNLDGIDGKRVKKLGNGYGLSTLRNCLILSGHTHRYHVNYPLIGESINQYSKLKFESQYHQGHHELINNTTLINNPGIGNPIGAPLRINATGGASIIEF